MHLYESNIVGMKAKLFQQAFECFANIVMHFCEPSEHTLILAK